jgi:fluoride exporter
MLTLVLIASGGAAGAVARYAVGQAVQRHSGDRWPWGTLAVNISGCLLLGIVLGAVGDRPLAEPLTAFLAVGFLGDYTTYSTFSGEAAALAVHRRAAAAAGYVTLSVAAGLLAVGGGFAVGSAVNRVLG